MAVKSIDNITSNFERDQGDENIEDDDSDLGDRDEFKASNRMPADDLTVKGSVGNLMNANPSKRQTNEHNYKGGAVGCREVHQQMQSQPNLRSNQADLLQDVEN